MPKPRKRILVNAKTNKNIPKRITPTQLAAADAMPAGGELVLYRASDGRIQLDVRVDKQTVWLTQAQMAKLFGRERSVVTKHINNVFIEKELDRKSNVQNLHIASSDKPVAFYSLDAIISVGYRVKSKQGTQFRIWATHTLRDHLLRGYTLNEKRLRERGFSEVEQAVELLANTLKNQAQQTYRHIVVPGIPAT